jgi:methylenetetrahydrofolate dehydrogenase (NADP+)/methenyltetrahydrofolate cyclohydrolase/formyltetrahydrofolate synthetase
MVVVDLPSPSGVGVIPATVAQTPKPVVDIAHEMGVQSDEIESYGKYKAKLELSILKRLQDRQDGKYSSDWTPIS